MPVISIISDSLPSDPYLSLLQYKIKKAIPDAEIILWAYGVQPFNLNQALILVESSINQLPEGSIHLVDITADEEKEQRFACGKIFHQWVVGRFSKIFGLLLMFNSLGYCQLSIRNQNAARLLGIKPGDQVLFYVRKKDSL